MPTCWAWRQSAPLLSCVSQNNAAKSLHVATPATNAPLAFAVLTLCHCAGRRLFKTRWLTDWRTDLRAKWQVTSDPDSNPALPSALSSPQDILYLSIIIGQHKFTTCWSSTSWLCADLLRHIHNTDVTCDLRIPHDATWHDHMMTCLFFLIFILCLILCSVFWVVAFTWVDSLGGHLNIHTYLHTRPVTKLYMTWHAQCAVHATWSVCPPENGTTVWAHGETSLSRPRLQKYIHGFCFVERQMLQRLCRHIGNNSQVSPTAPAPLSLSAPVPHFPSTRIPHRIRSMISDGNWLYCTWRITIKDKMAHGLCRL